MPSSLHDVESKVLLPTFQDYFNIKDATIEPVECVRGTVLAVHIAHIFLIAKDFSLKLKCHYNSRASRELIAAKEKAITGDSTGRSASISLDISVIDEFLNVLAGLLRRGFKSVAIDTVQGQPFKTSGLYQLYSYTQASDRINCIWKLSWAQHQILLEIDTDSLQWHAFDWNHQESDIDFLMDEDSLK